MKLFKSLLMCGLLAIVSSANAVTNDSYTPSSSDYFDVPRYGLTYRVYYHWNGGYDPMHTDPIDDERSIWDSVTVVKVNSFEIDTETGERTMLSNFTTSDYAVYRDSWCVGCPPFQHFHSAPVVGIEEMAFCEDGYEGAGARGYTITKVNMSDSLRWIDKEVFYNSSITEITIPEKVKIMNNTAFHGCENLRTVNWNAIHAEVVSESWSISYNSPFYVSPIENFNFGLNVEFIPAYLCAGLHNITSVSIPQKVTAIQEYTFDMCYNLSSITLPDNLLVIGKEAFSACYPLQSINLPNSLQTIEKYAFQYCKSLQFINWSSSLQSIEREAFYGCNFQSFILPENVAYIGSGCVAYNTNLKEVYIPSTAQMLLSDEYEYNSPIAYCSSLEKMSAPAFCFDIPESTYTINSKNLQEITVSAGELTPNAWGFINRSKKVLKKLDIAATANTHIEDEALDGCYKLTNLALPTSCEHIGYKALAECVMLNNITIPATVTEIDDRAFEDCRSLKTISFGGQAANASGRLNALATSTSQLQRIGNWAFYNAHELQNLTIPEGVTEIGDGAFYGCVYLEDLSLPASVQSIGDNTFALCAKLQKIVVNAPVPPSIQAKTFFDVTRQIPVFVPDESISAYENNALWGEFDIQGISHMPSAIDQINRQPNVKSQKLMKDGQILILRGEQTYTVMGQEVK